MMPPVRAGLLVALVVVGCSDVEVVVPAEPFALGTGRFLLHVSERTIGLVRDDEVLVTLDPTSFQVGVAAPGAEASDRSWDPWEVELHEDASGVRFLSPVGFTASAGGNGDAGIDLDFGEGISARVTIAAASPTRFTMTLTPAPPQPGSPAVVLARVGVRTSGDATEGFYGLGGQLDTVDNRSSLRAMQLELDDTIESKTNDAHAPVPLLIGTHGWAMFVPSRRTGVFDVVRKDASVVEATFAVGAGVPGGQPDPLRVDLFAADAPLDLYREYYAATEPVVPPPPWALGPWFWRDHNEGQAQVETDIAFLRALDLPASGVILRGPYQRAVNTFDFDSARFPDPAGLVAKARAEGLHVALVSTPYLEANAQPELGEATAKAFFPKTTGPLRNPWGPPIDFTKADASAFWRGLVGRFGNLGIDGFQLDYGEDIIPSVGSRRSVWAFADGTDERTMHERYSNLYHRAYSDAASGTGHLPFLRVRGAHWGEHSLGVVISSGDLDTTFTRAGQFLASREGTDVYGVGGLPASVIMTISLAASGFSFFASPAGGYLHGPADKETFIRWVEQAALSPVLELGDGSGELPWVETAENGRDAEALAALRSYSRLHIRLFPYVWSLAQRMTTDGRPLVRPVGLAYPELGRHPDDEYLLGDDLLVAPIVEARERSRNMVFPSGTWFDYWEAAPAGGNSQNDADVPAPLDRIPLYLRDGAIVPMLRPTIDTLAAADDPGIQSFERDPGALWALVAPGTPRSFELWDGSRIARVSPGAFTVKVGSVFRHGFALEMISTAEPAEVARDEVALPRVADAAILAEAASGWSWTNGRRGTLLVKLPPGDARVVVR